jgi:pyridoxal/pyridoxine/pyridoxamine kinase
MEGGEYLLTGEVDLSLFSLSLVGIDAVFSGRGDLTCTLFLSLFLAQSMARIAS